MVALRDRRYLLHDRDTKFTRSFRAILASGWIEPLALPARSPMNAYAERWVRSVNEEWTDRYTCVARVPLGMSYHPVSKSKSGTEGTLGTSSRSFDCFAAIRSITINVENRDTPEIAFTLSPTDGSKGDEDEIVYMFWGSPSEPHAYSTIEKIVTMAFQTGTPLSVSASDDEHYQKVVIVSISR
jgi:hypothetical protein